VAVDLRAASEACTAPVAGGLQGSCKAGATSDDDPGAVRRAGDDNVTSGAKEVAAAYRGAAWAEGPGVVYGLLAAELVAASPDRLTGSLVLDLGAGTGTASRAVALAGGTAVAVDASLDMLRHDQSRRPPAAVGDARRLPGKEGGFDAVVAAFVLSHVPDPASILREARLVTRPGAVILASSFTSRSSHPSKVQVEDVAARWGWRPPQWYQRLKSEFEPRAASCGALAEAARSAGLEAIVVEEREVSTGITSPEAVLAWRLGMAHLAPFVAALPGPQRSHFVGEARAAVGDRPQPLRPVILILSSRVPAHRERTSP
jgi:SAM-dependent methyltransferase